MRTAGQALLDRMIKNRMAKERKLKAAERAKIRKTVKAVSLRMAAERKALKAKAKKESSAVKVVKVPSVKAVKPKVLALESEGFALIHKKDRTISIASMRSNRPMVESLAEAFKVNGNYRIGRVRVCEVAT